MSQHEETSTAPQFTWRGAWLGFISYLVVALMVALVFIVK